MQAISIVLRSRGYFRSVWTAVYRFWAYLIWARKLGKPGEEDFYESKHRYCLRPATLLKKRLWHKWFPENFAKFLRTLFFIEHLRWLLLRHEFPANIYVFKVKKRNRKWCEIYSKLTIKIPERRQCFYCWQWTSKC